MVLNHSLEIFSCHVGLLEGDLGDGRVAFGEALSPELDHSTLDFVEVDLDFDGTIVSRLSY